MGSCASKGKSRDLIIAVDRYHMDKLKLNKTGSVEEGPSEKAKLPEPEDPPYYVEEKICVEEQTICIQTSSLGENRNTTEVTTITRDICIQTDRPMKKKKKKKHHEKKDSQEKEIEGRCIHFFQVIFGTVISCVPIFPILTFYRFQFSGRDSVVIIGGIVFRCGEKTHICPTFTLSQEDLHVNGEFTRLSAPFMLH